jgi:hypothetical protein
MIEHLNAPFEILRRTDIIVRRPLKVLASGQLKDIFVIPGRTSILFMAVVADTPILSGIGSANLLRAICRGII